MPSSSRCVSRTDHTREDIRLDGRRLLVSTSYSQSLPQSNVLAVADFILVHGNGVHSPSGMGRTWFTIRKMCGGNPRPIVFNEDDHYHLRPPVTIWRRP